ncbi:unnamed protein product [Arctia plantaginis]|uniref:Uncharacterized protein n=1 Tax=Arctia plantaginis TaxID=874455 RepID=A0A8S1AFY6_ARCPL|nr:unnamed protein product [Arctia plantaginis]
MASKGISKYLANPLNAFTLIKRLVTDLKYVKHLIKSGEENIHNVTTKHENIKYPTSEDLIGAVKGLMSLEEVYKLDIKEIANGKLNGFVYSAAMTAGDCYEFARILFNELDPESAVTLMEEALPKYYEEKFPYLFTDIEIMEYISYGNYMLGNPKIALYWTNKILNIEPNHSRSRNSLIRFQKDILDEETKPNKSFESEEESFEQETEKVKNVL